MVNLDARHDPEFKPEHHVTIPAFSLDVNEPIGCAVVTDRTQGFGLNKRIYCLNA
jgi:hypothetical protein